MRSMDFCEAQTSTSAYANITHMIRRTSWQSPSNKKVHNTVDPNSGYQLFTKTPEVQKIT